MSAGDIERDLDKDKDKDKDTDTGPYRGIGAEEAFAQRHKLRGISSEV